MFKFVKFGEMIQIIFEFVLHDISFLFVNLDIWNPHLKAICIIPFRQEEDAGKYWFLRMSRR
jgi:hypothetical protein